VDVGTREITETAQRLHTDQPAQQLVGLQSVHGRDLDQLGTDRVPLCGEPRAMKGLHEQAVQGEGEQRGVARAAGSRHGLRRGEPTSGVGHAARFESDRGQKSRPLRSGCVSGKRGECAFGRGHDGCRLFRVVGAAPDRRDVVGADDAGGQLGVSQLLGGEDARHPLVARGHEPAAAGHGEAAQEVDGGPEASTGVDGHRAAVDRDGLGPDLAGRGADDRCGVEVGGLPEDVGLGFTQPRAGGETEVLAQSRARATDDLERVLLPSGPVQRDRQQAPSLLAPRMLRSMSVQVGHDSVDVPDVEQRAGAELDGAQPQLREPGPLGACPEICPPGNRHKPVHATR
jgi:hypothetical protein